MIALALVVGLPDLEVVGQSWNPVLEWSFEDALACGIANDLVHCSLGIITLCSYR